uniref:Uncharacterized protein n=1 Tax=Anguilla anguilla TaxID=7936 RepID=A0A0E9VK34_ANGAN
MDASVNTL